MKKLLAPLLAVAVILTVLFSVRSVIRDIREMTQWSADTTRVFDSVEVHRLIHDTVEVLNARSDSAIASALTDANRFRTLRTIAEHEGDSLQTLLDSARTTVDSLRLTTAKLTTTETALNHSKKEAVRLRAANDSLIRKSVRLKVDNKTAWADVDSLSALVRRVPSRGCRVVGILPCPHLVAGAGVTQDGLGWFVGVGLPLR